MMHLDVHTRAKVADGLEQEADLRQNPLLRPPTDPVLCEVDNQPILTMAYKGTGVCSQRCEKEREHKIEQEEFLQP